MRLLILLVAALLAAFPALAQGAPPPDATVEDRLDYWFARLLTAADENEAAEIELQIQQLWLQSGSATVDLLMEWSIAALDAGNTGRALDLLDGAISILPEFAEAWHRRAIVHFSAGDLANAIADVEQTLILEPRHFGALAGLGQILAQARDYPRALQALNAALAINPKMAGTGDLAAQIDDRIHRDI